MIFSCLAYKDSCFLYKILYKYWNENNPFLLVSYCSSTPGEGSTACFACFHRGSVIPSPFTALQVWLILSVPRSLYRGDRNAFFSWKSPNLGYHREDVIAWTTWKDCYEKHGTTPGTTAYDWPTHISQWLSDNASAHSCWSITQRVPLLTSVSNPRETLLSGCTTW